MFIDYTKAFDSISQVQMFEILSEMGFQKYLVTLLGMLYNDISAVLRWNGRHCSSDLRCHTLVTSQNGYLKAWNKSRGTRGIVLDGEDWCDVRHGRLIITPDGTTKEIGMVKLCGMVELSSFLRTSPGPNTSHFMSVLLPVFAHDHLLVLFLHCMLRSSFDPSSCGGSS